MEPDSQSLKTPPPLVRPPPPPPKGNVVSPGKCSVTTTDSYKTGIAYAVKHLSEVAPHAAIYIDAAHGGWMGYETNAAKFADVVISMGNPTPPLPHPYPTPTPP